jgi:predicted DNA-binding protein
MHGPQDPQPRHVRDRVRYQARLDAETVGTLEALSRAFHRKRGQVLRHVMPWGITHGTAWTIDRSIPASPHIVPLLLEPALLQQVHDAAAAHGASVAAWLRHALRHVTPADFPPSWQAGEAAPRSHDSAYDGTRFVMRLDPQTRATLKHFSDHFDQPVAAVIRQVVRQARIEDFPERWHLAVNERRAREDRSTP